MPPLPLLAALAAASPASAAPDAEPTFAVQPYGFVVPSFTYIADDPRALTAQDGAALAARIGVDSRLAVGKSAGAVAARIEVELTPEPQLKDAVVSYRPVSFLRFDGGQFKVPYGLGYLASDTRRLLPSTPQAYTDLTNRDMGLTLTASLPIRQRVIASVQGGVFNGEGPNRLQNVNQRYLYAVRGVITPFGARDRVFEGSDGALYLGLGGGWVYNYIGADASAEEINQYAGELQFAWNVVSLQGEYLAGTHAFANAAVQDYAQNGWYGTLGLFVPAPWTRDHLQLVARVGEAEPDDEVVGDFAGQVAPHAREYTGGVNLYWVAPPRAFHDLKLQLAYSAFEELEGEPYTNARFTTAVTVRF